MADDSTRQPFRDRVADNPLRLWSINLDVNERAWESATLLRIGRLTSSDIALEHQSVSRRHAELLNVEGVWRVRDLGSRNGTYLNGDRLGREERQLQPFDTVQFGNVAMLVDVGLPCQSVGEASSAALRQFFSMFLTATNARYGALFLPEPRRGSLELCATTAWNPFAGPADRRGTADDSMNRTGRIFDSFSWKAVKACFESGEVARVDPWALNPDWAMDESGGHEFLYVPIERHGKRLGVLVLESWCLYAETALHLAARIARALTDSLALWLTFISRTGVRDALADRSGRSQDRSAAPTKRAAWDWTNFDPRWLSADVTDLASAIHSDQAYDRMPILGDALQDAGCDDEEAIRHCRQDSFHGPSCSVLGRILGKDRIRSHRITVANLGGIVNPGPSIERSHSQLGAVPVALPVEAGVMYRGNNELEARADSEHMPSSSFEDDETLLIRCALDEIGSQTAEACSTGTEADSST